MDSKLREVTNEFHQQTEETLREARAIAEQSFNADQLDRILFWLRVIGLCLIAITFLFISRIRQ